MAGKKPALQNSHFCFDHVNRLKVNFPTIFKALPRTRALSIAKAHQRADQKIENKLATLTKLLNY